MATDRTVERCPGSWILKQQNHCKVEYYQKRTKNSLTDITLAPSLGFSSIPENLGTIENKGVEFAASFIPYKDASREAYWIINFNGSHNRDKMTKISNALEYMNSVNAGKLDATPLPRYEEGQSLNNIWVVKSLGIDPATGQEVFQKRITGELTGVWDAVDVIPYGNTEPKLQGNIYSTFNYKGFGVSVGFNYRFGGQVYNNTLVLKSRMQTCVIMRTDAYWIYAGKNREMS